MELKTLYKIISGSATEVEHVLNVLAKDDWRPVAMTSTSRPPVITVILENKIMEEAKLQVSSAVVGDTAGESSLEEIQ